MLQSRRIQSAVLLSAIFLLNLINPVASWSVPTPRLKRPKVYSPKSKIPKPASIATNPKIKNGAVDSVDPAKPVLSNGNKQPGAPAATAANRGGALQLPPRIMPPARPAMMVMGEQNSEELTKPLRRNGVLNSATTATLALMASFVPPDNTAASDEAAKVAISSFPPTTIQLDLRDIPLVGGMISGTWAKVAPLQTTKPSIAVGSPTDKFGAIRNFLDRGRLEFDVGGLIKTHLNVDIEPNDQGGFALIRLSSKLIPKWPFGRTAKSKWNRVTNMGNGETYYFDSVSGEAQYEEPEEFL